MSVPASTPSAPDLSIPLTDGRAEFRLALGALAVIAALAVPVLAVSGAVAGAGGVLGAAAGLALVTVLFVAAGFAQGVAARRSNTTAVAVAAAGLGLRLAVYLGALWALGRVSMLHRPSLAIATAVGFVVTLYYEIRLIGRTPELFWVRAGEATARERGSQHASTQRS